MWKVEPSFNMILPSFILEQELKNDAVRNFSPFKKTEAANR